MSKRTNSTVNSDPDGSNLGGGGVGRALASNLRHLRDAAGLSLAELAELAGIAKGTVATIEGGRANPTVETIYALASALGCEMPALLADTPDPMLVEVRHSDPMPRTGAVDGRLLQRFAPTGTVEVFEVSLQRRGLCRSKPHPQGVYEHVWVASGRADLGPDERPFELAAGDYVCFAGWVDHHYRALEVPLTMLMLLSFARTVPAVPVLRHLI